MRTIRTIVFLFTLFPAFACSKTEKKDEGQQPARKAYEKGFYIAGYLLNTGNLDAASAALDYGKITHLNIAFINPDPEGLFSEAPGLENAVKRAHENHVKVLFSFGGGSAPAFLKELVKAGKRAAFINELTRLAVTYDLDGVDVDLEGDFIDENYEAFISGLSASLKLQHKMMTAAVATWNGNAISDKALALFDLIHIMSYDQTGPWDKSRPGPHSTYEAAVNDFIYWNSTRAVPAGKLTLGLPFYGYGFGPSVPESLSYGEIVNAYPGAELSDSAVLAGRGTIYYNGPATIRKKVMLALDKKAGGVMIWQLGGDAPGDQSLLGAINAVIP